LPKSIDAEQGLLASCLMDIKGKNFHKCIDFGIKPSFFFKKEHKIIFSVLISLFELNVPINELVLCDKLEEVGKLDEIGGRIYISEILDRNNLIINLDYYIKKIHNSYILRELHKICNDTSNNIFLKRKFNSSDAIFDVEEKLKILNKENSIHNYTIKIEEYIDAVLPIIKNGMLDNNKEELFGIKTGFSKLDQLTFGFHAQEMIVIAARPSMGKTSLALNMAENIIFSNQKNKKILIFSLEMSAEQIVLRMLCSRSKINICLLRERKISSYQMDNLLKTSQELKKSNLWIDDSGYLTISELRMRARKLHQKEKLSIIYIDYLQLIRGINIKLSREQQIADISRGIKAMAKEFNIPIVVLSQLNRDSERERRQPKLFDLRESGSIEQDADLVFILTKNKEGYFQEDRNEYSRNEIVRKLIIAKQRNGPIGEISLKFFKNLVRFEDL
jgi:replicative DNA helicase